MLWVLAGGAVAWVGLRFFQINTNRPLIVVIIIGAVGALIGGQSLAPLIGSAPEPAGVFNPFALVVALATATASLIIGDIISKRFKL